jgi:CheY-like chemotaxis protein
MIKILLVDDVQLFLDLERSFLKRTGCDVLTATSGDDAIDKVRAHRPALVLTDVDLAGGLDGIALCRAIREDPALANTRVVFVTSPLDYPRCSGAGADGFLSKPVVREQLLEVVGRFVPLQQRSSERLRVALEARFERSGSEKPALVRDLGSTGVFLSTREKLEPGDTLDVTFNLPAPGGSTIRARGEVVRTVREGSEPERVPGAGVRFHALSARSRLEISRFLRENMEETP